MNRYYIGDMYEKTIIWIDLFMGVISRSYDRSSSPVNSGGKPYCVSDGL